MEGFLSVLINMVVDGILLINIICDLIILMKRTKKIKYNETENEIF